MDRKLFFLSIILLNSFFLSAQNAEEDVLKTVNSFFHSLEAHDSISFSKLFIESSRNYYVLKQKDSIKYKGSPFNAEFGNNIIKERFRKDEVEVNIRSNIASVSGPYDLWINDKFSHCGYEIFTLINTSAGWKIASLTLTIEYEGCKN